MLLFPATEMAFSQSAASEKTETVGSDDGSAGYVKGITSARARSLVGGALGLISVIIGWRVKARAKQNTSRSWKIAALVLGILAILWSINHLAGGAGSFGTGGGKAGAIVAIVLGMIGIAFSGPTLMSRKA